MSEAIRLIVDGFVKLSDHKALEDQKAHRHRLANELKALTGPVDLNSLIKQLEEEIAVVDAGLAKLNSAATA